jgi:hypothetical protein
MYQIKRFMMSDDSMISKEKYLEQFKGKEAKAFDRAWKNRDFEINLSWQRAIYFWAFIVLAYTGYFSMKPEQEINRLFIALTGEILSFIWLLVHLGSKKWQVNWEKHIDMLEDKEEGPIYKMVLDQKSHSVTKLSTSVAILNMINWLLLLVAVFLENQKIAPNGLYLGGSALVILVIAFSLIFWGTRTSERKEFSFKLREIKYKA